MLEITVKQKFEACHKAGYRFIDFDGWNVTLGGHRFKKEFKTFEDAVRWAYGVLKASA